MRCLIEQRRDRDDEREREQFLNDNPVGTFEGERV